MSKKAGIFKETSLFRHRIPQGHKETPERLFAIYNELDSENYKHKFKYYKPLDIQEEDLHPVHSSFYINQLKKYSLNKNPFSYDPDTYLMEESLATAKTAVGGCLSLANAIIGGEVDRGFSLIRPPGHHAEAGRGMGFCIFNNIALTAKYLQEKYGLTRILIVDFDVHHGNGTQDIFYNSSEVLVLSIHQKNIFPFTGSPDQTGEAGGKGYNINVEVPSQYGDEEYAFIFGKVVQNVFENFMPQIVLVSAGFDGHKDDPISTTCISDNGFSRMAKFLNYYSKKYGNDKILYILEGGYSIKPLFSSVVAVLNTLTTDSKDVPSFVYSARAEKLLQEEMPAEIKGKWGVCL